MEAISVVKFKNRIVWVLYCMASWIWFFQFQSRTYETAHYNRRQSSYIQK